MKNLKKLSLALIASASLLTMSCSNKDDGDDLDDENCYEYLQELAVDLSNKAQVFSQNPTTANCMAVKNAGILLSEEAVDCGFQEFVTIAAQYKDLDCSVFN